MSSRDEQKEKGMRHRDLWMVRWRVGVVEQAVMVTMGTKHTLASNLEQKHPMAKFNAHVVGVHWTTLTMSKGRFDSFPIILPLKPTAGVTAEKIWVGTLMPNGPTTRANAARTRVSVTPIE